MTYQRLSEVFAVVSVVVVSGAFVSGAFVSGAVVSGAFVSGAFVSVIAAVLTIAHEFHAVQEDRVEARDEQADPQAHHEDEHGQAAGLGERRPGDLLELGPGLVDVAADGRSKASYAIHDR